MSQMHPFLDDAIAQSPTIQVPMNNLYLEIKQPWLVNNGVSYKGKGNGRFCPNNRSPEKFANIKKGFHAISRVNSGIGRTIIIHIVRLKRVPLVLTLL